MHPTEPFSWNLRSIVIHVNMWCIFHPSIAAIEVVIVLIIFVSVFIRANVFANFQFVESGNEKQREKIKMCLRAIYTIHNYIITTHRLKGSDSHGSMHLPIQFKQTVANSTIETDDFEEPTNFIQAQDLR